MPKCDFLRPATLLNKSVWHRCFSVNFAKFLRTSFLRNTSGDCSCFQDRCIHSAILKPVSHLWDELILTYIFMRINIILLVGTLRITSKKLILQIIVRLFVYSHKNNIKTFWYYPHNNLIRLVRSKKDRRNICYFWRQLIKNESTNKI